MVDYRSSPWQQLRDNSGALAIWDNGQPSGNHGLPTIPTDWHIV